MRLRQDHKGMLGCPSKGDKEELRKAGKCDQFFGSSFLERQVTIIGEADVKKTRSKDDKKKNFLPSLFSQKSEKQYE